MTKPLLILLVSLLIGGLVPETGMAQQKDRKTAPATLPAPHVVFADAEAFAGKRLNSQQAAARFLELHFSPALYGRLELVHTVKSPQGTHYTYRQLFDHRPIYRSELKLNLDPSGRILSLISGLHIIRDKQSFTVLRTETLAQAHLRQLLGKEAGNVKYTAEEVVFADNNQLQNGLLLTYGSRNTSLGSKEILLDSKGRLIEENNLISNYKQHGHSHSHGTTSAPARPAAAAVRDTAISALVYRQMPNIGPVAGIRKAPAANAAPVISKLNEQRQKVQLYAGFRNDTFLLQSPYCVIKEFDPPVRPVHYSLTPDIDFGLADEGFEQVNILYHITTWQQYLQSLGFRNLANYQVEVDANGWNGQDQSSYSAFTNTLSFGTGGVEDGQDPQVIIHEYSHAIARSATAGPAYSHERKVLEEANADYFAVSYKRSVDPTDWHRIFSWDGHNEFWAGRMAVSDHTYPADMSGDIYADAAIWTATLMQIQEQIGREVTDRLLLQSLYSYSSYLGMPSAARLLLQADQMLYNGSHRSVIANAFTARGILQGPEPVQKPAAAAAAKPARVHTAVHQH